MTGVTGHSSYQAFWDRLERFLADAKADPEMGRSVRVSLVDRGEDGRFNTVWSGVGPRWHCYREAIYAVADRFGLDANFAEDEYTDLDSVFNTCCNLIEARNGRVTERWRGRS